MPPARQAAPSSAISFAEAMALMTSFRKTPCFRKTSTQVSLVSLLGHIGPHVAMSQHQSAVPQQQRARRLQRRRLCPPHPQCSLPAPAPAPAAAAAPAPAAAPAAAAAVTTLPVATFLHLDYTMCNDIHHACNRATLNKMSICA